MTEPGAAAGTPGTAAEGLDFLVPGDLDTPTGGYIYDRRLLQGLRDLGWRVTLHRLDGSFPYPTPDACTAAAEILARAPSGSLVLVDGLALGAMPELAAAHAGRLRLIGLVHHPLAEETGLAASAVRALRAAEGRALTAVRGVVATSRYTAGLVAAMGVPTDRIRVVEPGTDPAPLARGSGSPTLRLLCVGALIHRKGHGLLVDALARHADRDWHLTCVGSLDREPATVADLEACIARRGLVSRVALLGEVDAATLARLYDRADLFVLATRFEGYGMALAEALARGLPVVSTRTGAVPETVPDAAGLLAAADDPAALAAVLGRVLDGPANGFAGGFAPGADRGSDRGSDRGAGLRRRLAQGARAARGRLPTWELACRRMEQALRALGR